MAVYQEKDKGTWRVVFRYTDFTGERKQTQKRGFKTKREATAWEHEMMLRKGNKLDMTFERFYEIYSEYKRQRVKESTFETKSHIVRTKILPYFGKRKINEITVADVIAWQNEMMAYRDEKGKPYATHDMQLVSEWAERIIVLYQGHVLADGSRNEIFGNKEVVEKVGIRPPDIFTMGKELHKDAFCYTVDEFLQSFV